MNISLTKNRIILMVLVLIIIGSGIGAGIHVRSIMKSNDATIATLQKEKADVQISLDTEKLKRIAAEQAKDEAINSGAIVYNQKETFSKALSSLAGSFEDLDKLILSDDSRNLDAHAWYHDNCQFTIADGTLAAANIRNEDWQQKQIESTTEYRRIKASLEDTLDALKQGVAISQELQSSSLKSGSRSN